MFYAGIGSRKAPTKVLSLITKVALALDKRGYTLRSGGALGCDLAFEKGSSQKEIFRSTDAEPWAFDLVKKYMPIDSPSNFDNFNPYVKGLLARNMMILLGNNKENPARFVLCWTPLCDYLTSKAGGSGYGLRCALDNNIPIYNLNNLEQIKAFNSNYLATT